MMKILTYGVCLVVFCLPLYLVRFEIFGIPTTVLEVMIYGLFVLWLIKGFKLGQFKKLPIAILLILIGVSLATIFSSDLRISAGIWKAWFIDPLLFFVVVISVVKNSRQIKKILYSLFLSGTVIAIISLIYLIQGNLDPTGRLQAFYNSPNYLAMYLAPGLILSLGLFFMEKEKVLKILFLVSCFLFLVTLFFTQSFGAYLGIVAAIGFGFYCLRSGLKHRWFILGLSLIFVLALGIFAIIQRPASLEGRLIIWQKALSVYKNNPILGIGPGTFGDYLQPHNIFLAFLLQTGIIGFIGFIWLLVWFYKNFQFSLASPSEAGRAIFNFQLLSVMTYILVHGLVDTTYWKNDLAVIFWLIIALCYIINHRVCSRKTNNLLKEKETAQ